MTPTPDIAAQQQPQRYRVNPAIFAALDKLGPWPLPFLVPDADGECVLHRDIGRQPPAPMREGADRE
jgi:hypothetical protein